MSRLIYHKITPQDEAALPVTLSEAKHYCRIDFTDDDTIIQSLIETSTHQLQEYCCRVFQVSDCIAIYRQELGGDSIRLSYSDNIVIADDSPYSGKIIGDAILKTDDTEVTLTYTAGYETYPEWVKQAVLMDIAYRYENRGDVAAMVINTEVKEFLKPYVKWFLI